ncbi:transcriptional regulator [Halorhabdus sp. CBA1104]|uniref:helix-turn-helix transcriptional regulator n=1 Tax=unclassified Halorhabdus TaxID=2621901 RepID=UPI0012B3FBE3|nr:MULTISPECIES: helix-turn-helix transcriptional regulator [unclassified Halorhabdus]QGN06408.1 transcriptional regulator [Halorhabdus sp. CBA1104]
MDNDIEVRRVKHDLTQEDLAKALDVTRQTIGAIEQGRYDPRLELAFDLADFFDTTVDDLFWREDAPETA